MTHQATGLAIPDNLNLTLAKAVVILQVFDPSTLSLNASLRYPFRAAFSQKLNNMIIDVLLYV